ncbi:ABC transporter substrate-binding protein [Chelativorans xinjiangense]|uniref:ABC transporter substrate-binding protein n=1 Tax=Chelativorans xinjiangense TaxID=2681485 RepID=UPI00135C4850|nr:sugar ABC transporter substrate-binding protein [Chelativorans xinjiangense]
MRVLNARRVGAAVLATATAAFMTGTVFAQEMTMWVRDGTAANAGKVLVDLWNESRPDNRIELTVIPNLQMVTKLATSIAAGEPPDLISLDLIYMPDFMKADSLVDISDEAAENPNFDKVIDAYKDISSYEGRTYGTGFAPDVSVIAWNKDLFREAGLDPEKPPRTIYEIHEMAKKIAALGDDTYGFYFAGSCPGCNIFVTSPLMVAGGAKILPRDGEDTALEGEAVKEVLQVYRDMWTEGLVPESAETDNGANFVSGFTNGNVGIAGTGGFVIPLMESDFPDLDYGVALLPGLEEGQVSGFVGGDTIAIPRGSKNEELAREFINWVLTDEAQLEGLAKNGILPVRADLATDNKYFADQPKVQVTAEALKVGYVPWVFHFADMVNSDASPWINMLQRAVFDGEIDEAIEEARERMIEIAGE